MKVLFLTYSTDITGADLSMLALAQNLPIQSKVVTLSHGPIVDLARSRGVDIHVIEHHSTLLSLSNEASFLGRLMSLWQLPLIGNNLRHVASGYDVIYVHAKKALLFGSLASILSKRHLIWHQRDVVHSPSSLHGRTRISEWVLIKILNRFATKIFSVSKAAANSFVNAGGNPRLLKVVLNGINPEDFLTPVSPDLLRKELLIPANAPLIGCFGQLLPWKGHSILLNAMMELPSAHLVIVGGVGSANPTYDKELRDRALRLGIADRVHFTGRRSDVPSLMRSVDVIVHPSVEFDPCPRVVIEALHSGTPLVATAVGGVPELLTNEVHGLLVPPSDHHALSTAVSRLLNNIELAQKLSTAGQQHAAERLTLSRVISDVARELQALRIG